jgi:predicted MFS family arabinose efflux permease
MTTSAAPTQTRGSFMSINSSIQNLSSALAAYIGGLIIYKNEMGVIFNYNYVGYLAITLNILAIFVAIKLQKTK